MMNLKKLGKLTSNIQVEKSEHGVWLFIYDKEYFLPYKEYPWFKNAKDSTLNNVKLLFGNHLHWPDLDVDLELDSLEHPEKYLSDLAQVELTRKSTLISLFPVLKVVHQA